MTSPAYVNRIKMKLLLRSPQVEYLEYLAEREASSLSNSLEWLIKDKMRTTALIVVNPARKVLQCYSLDAECVAFLDRLCVLQGLERSDVVRRLVDDAKMKDDAV